MKFISLFDLMMNSAMSLKFLSKNSQMRDSTKSKAFIASLQLAYLYLCFPSLRLRNIPKNQVLLRVYALQLAQKPSLD